MIRVGSKVEVVRKGMRYSCYDSWVENNFPEYLNYFKFQEYSALENGTTGIILGIANHSSRDDKTLALILTTDKYLAIININGLKTIDSKSLFSTQTMLDLLEINPKLKFKSRNRIVGLFGNVLYRYDENVATTPAKLNITELWELVEDSKPVDFMEAFNALQTEYKDIYCIHDGNRIYYKQDSDIDHIFRESQIADGKWFIIE